MECETQNMGNESSYSKQQGRHFWEKNPTVTSDGNKDRFLTTKRPLFKEPSFYEQKEQQTANQF